MNEATGLEKAYQERTKQVMDLKVCIDGLLPYIIHYKNNCSSTVKSIVEAEYQEVLKVIGTKV